ncbi:MAG: zf-HC2 domain-containing protein [Deltaproteobacteria bacterium]|nr:zf-HC2 domain-containing protein [Deltaproteobacteria bacterium]MBI3076271.1 zf-HC2 domain-containing protein [Deltaproteobacteria bacterium]
MECDEVQERLIRFLKGELGGAEAGEARAHLAQCPACAAEQSAEQGLTRALQSSLPRYAAPPHVRERLRAALRETGGAGGYGVFSFLRRPWAAALAGAGVTALLLVGVYAAFLRPRPDPFGLLVQEVLRTHQGLVLQQELQQVLGAPGPQINAMLRERLGIGMEAVFAGDADAILIEVRPLSFQGRQGVAFVYRYRSGRVGSLMVVRGPEVALPQAGRVQIETFRPVLVTGRDANALVWKQQDLAYALVTPPIPLDRMGRMFLKVRKAPRT